MYFVGSLLRIYINSLIIESVLGLFWLFVRYYTGGCELVQLCIVLSILQFVRFFATELIHEQTIPSFHSLIIFPRNQMHSCNRYINNYRCECTIIAIQNNLLFLDVRKIVLHKIYVVIDRYHYAEGFHIFYVSFSPRYQGDLEVFK